MNNLIIDEGNSLCKLTIVANGNIIAHIATPNIEDFEAIQFIEQYPIAKIISTSTRSNTVNLPKQLIGIPYLHYTSEIKPPININYNPVSSLGLDRIAAAVGAHKLFPNSNALIIDIGTAITADFITADGTFCGGIISPGPEIRAKALNHFTGKLPLVELSEKTKIRGNSTKEAIQYGVLNGIQYEIEGYIAEYQKIHHNVQVITTGGFAFLFPIKDNKVIFNQHLVTIGLNEILEHNTPQ